MRSCRFAGAACALAALVTLAAGATVASITAETRADSLAEHQLRPGLYEIEVSSRRVSGPQVTTQSTVLRCLSAAALQEHRTFEVLTATPAAGCPKYEICTNGPRTGLQTLCEDGVGVSAVGMFALERDRFRGRIDIDRESQERALIEIQYGTRVGDCPGYMRLLQTVRSWRF